MAAIHPYLNFPGTTEEAFVFYRSVFGGEFSSLQRFGEMANCQGLTDGADKIMHISLPIGKDTVLMATDALESMGQKVSSGNNFHITIQAESEEEAGRLFNALSAGGEITMPLDKAVWGAYFGMLTDRFGIQWMVNYDYSRN